MAFTLPSPAKSSSFVPQPAWEQLPAGWSFVEVAGVATDSRDNVLVFNRGEHPVIIFDREGRFLGAWGDKELGRPHGIHVGPDDSVYLTYDIGHAVYKFTADGKLLLTLGTPFQGSATGAVGFDYRTIRESGLPFNLPTNLALSSSGEMYITDGYGNARVHKFSPDGKLLFSWGTPGTGPGQFQVPHGIAIDREGLIYVADRENSRIQIFTPEGRFLRQWSEIARPCQIFITPQDEAYIAELGYQAGLFPWVSKYGPEFTGGRVSVFNLRGELLHRWGGGKNPCAAGDFIAPHDICVDSRGDVYVGEVVMSAAACNGLVPPTCHSLQKFVRQ